MIQAKIDPKYEVLKKLREGGMGAIYLVRHRLLDELRVVKVLRSQVAEDADLRERFQREARAAIQLRHPNIAQLYDFSIDEDGTAYIILEYIDGITLEEFGRQPEARDLRLTLEIAQQALRALGYLHRKGFIHRDIAPDNLMLTRDVDGNPLVKLIDLGIVKVLRGDGKRTATSVYLGKPKYSSPEQLTRPDIDARSDLYSFGVMLYELVTGVYPIQGHDLPSLVTAHLHREPLSFEVSDPQGRIPDELRALLLSALSKNPEERPASAEEFASRLAAIAHALQVQGGAEPQTLAERARQGARQAREVQLEEFAQAVRAQMEQGHLLEAKGLLAEAYEQLGHDTRLAGLEQEVEQAERAQREAVAKAARLEELVQRAEAALARGDVAEARAKVFEIVAHDPRNTRALDLERRIEELKRQREAQLAQEPTQATQVAERTAGGTPLGSATLPDRFPAASEDRTTIPFGGFPGKKRVTWLVGLGVPVVLLVGAVGLWWWRGAAPNAALEQERSVPLPSAAEAYEKARSLRSQRRLEEAARWARFALQEDPVEREGYYPRALYGLLLAELGRCEESNALVQTSEEANVAPNDPLWQQVTAARQRCQPPVASAGSLVPFGPKLEELEGHLTRLYQQVAELRQLQTGPAVAALWKREPELQQGSQRVLDLLSEAERVLAIARSRQNYDQLLEVENRLADASLELRMLLKRAMEAAGREREATRGAN